MKGTTLGINQIVLEVVSFNFHYNRPHKGAQMDSKELDELIRELFGDPLDNIDLSMESLFPKLPAFNRKLIQLEPVAHIRDKYTGKQIFGGWLAYVAGTPIDGVGLTQDDAIHEAIIKWHQLLAQAQTPRVLLTPPPSVEVPTLKTKKELSRNKKRKSKKK